MPFTGKLGSANSAPSSVVPMFGAGGHRYNQSFSGQLSFAGAIANTIAHIFRQVSVTFYRAVNRAIQGWSEYSVVVLGDHPIGYWRLADNNSTSIFDYSGFLNLGAGHGTITVSQSGALHDSSNSMLFNGSTGYISTQFTKSGLFAASIEVLVNFTSTASGPLSIFTNRINTSDPSLTLSLNRAFPGVPTTNSPGLVGFGYDTANTYIGGYNAAGINDGNWHHIVGVWNSNFTTAIASSQFSLYIDGQLKTLTSQTLGSATAPVAFLSGSYIGQSPQWASSFYPGSLQEVAFYAYALTPQQITNHYNAFIPFPPAGMSTTLRTSQ